MITGQVARAMILKQVAAELKNYVREKKLGKLPKRICLCGCGVTFAPKMRWHFLAGDDCRRRWYGGWIRPRRTD